MNNDKHLSARIEEALNSLNGIRSASPGPFFFTRVQARLNNKEKNFWEKSSAFIARPVVAIAVILAVVVMNSVVIFQQKTAGPALTEQTETYVYDEFNLAANSFYDYEITEP